MLVLSRKRGESLVIGDAIVTVKQSSAGRVVLCVDAPQEVKILRKELADAKEDGGRG